MAAHGLEEARATLARVKANLVGGLVWESALPDDVAIPRRADGKVAAHIIMDFGAPVKSMRDRNLTNPELGQPHTLPLNAACIAGDADSARATMAALMELLVDWAPSETSDPWEAKGGYGTNRPATGNSPSRFIAGIFLETVVNQGI